MTLSYDYYPAVFNAIELISQGYTKTHACDNVGISIPTFARFVKEVPELAEALVEAETRGYDAMAEALLRIDNHAIYGQSDPKMATLISANIKWLLSKRRVKDYGEKVAIDINITADKAITQSLALAQQRVQQLALAPPDDAIDTDFMEVEDDEAILASLLV